ncbi:MAG: FlgD immunoglobulin-like domain containing protein [Candidatus Eisenbacteria bacterium]
MSTPCRLPIATSSLGLILVLLGFAATSASALGEHGWIPNRGQWDGAVTFLARGNGVDVYLTEDSVILDVFDEATALRLPLSSLIDPASAEPREPAVTRLNFFLGDDPSRWATNVPTYGEVVLRDGGAGDELWLRAERNALFYHHVSSGGAGATAPRPLLEGCEGAEALPAVTNGAVVIRVGDTYLEDIPLDDISLEDISLENVSVEGTSLQDISLEDSMSEGTSVGNDEWTNTPPDPLARGPLPYERVISWRPGGGGSIPPPDDGSEDPDEPDDRQGEISRLLYSTYLGGWDNDRAHALLIDSESLPVLAGYTRSSNFPATPGSYDTSHNGDYDCHVCKFNGNGSELLWATFLGGSLEDRVFAIHQDEAGDLVISGHTYSANFPATTGAFDRTLGGPRDAYAAKLNSTGSVLYWCTYLGGDNYDRSWDMNLDSEGRPILSGDTQSQDFPTTPDSFQPFPTPGSSFSEGFSTKLRADGSGLVWSTYLGGSGLDGVKFMDMGDDDAPVLCGSTTSSDFPSTLGAYDETWNGIYDVFVTKLSSDGRSLVYSTFLGGTGSDFGEVIVAVPSGDVILTGSTQSTNFPTTDHAFDRTHNGLRDAFVARLSAAGDSLRFSTYVGGSGDDEPWALTVDGQGSPYFSGYVQSVDFPTTNDAFDFTHNGLQDANLTKLDPSGSSLVYSTYFGGVDLDGGWELVMHPSGHPVLTGPTASPDFPTTSGAYDQTHNGGRDVFLAEFEIRDPTGIPEIPEPPPGSQDTRASRDDIFLSVAPNPFFETVDVRFSLPTTRAIDARIIDASGRLVAPLFRGDLASGDHAVSWNGRDERGRPAPAGVYWVRVRVGTAQTSEQTFEERIVLIR